MWPFASCAPAAEPEPDARRRQHRCADPGGGAHDEPVLPRGAPIEAAEAKPHPDYPLDGLGLLKVLEKPGAPVPRGLFWRMKYRSQRAVRSGDWKYFASEDGEFLFNLALDARERANYARREPARFAELRAKYEAWEKSIPPMPPDAAFSIPYSRADVAQPS